MPDPNDDRLRDIATQNAEEPSSLEAFVEQRKTSMRSFQQQLRPEDFGRDPATGLPFFHPPRRSYEPAVVGKPFDSEARQLLYLRHCAFLLVAQFFYSDLRGITDHLT